jgi:hypothetical protein
MRRRSGTRQRRGRSFDQLSFKEPGGSPVAPPVPRRTLVVLLDMGGLFIGGSTRAATWLVNVKVYQRHGDPPAIRSSWQLPGRFPRPLSMHPLQISHAEREGEGEHDREPDQKWPKPRRLRFCSGVLFLPPPARGAGSLDRAAGRSQVGAADTAHKTRPQDLVRPRIATTCMEHREQVLDTIIEYYNGKPLAWGGIDLFLVPGDGALARMCDFAAFFHAVNDGQAPIFSQVWLVWPDPAEEDDLRAGVRTRLTELWERSRGTPPTPEQLDRLSERVRIVFPETRDVETVSRLVRAAEARAVLVVGRASVYRSPRVDGDSPLPPMPGDAWAPHLHTLMEKLREQAEAVGCHVVLDVDEAPPARRTLFDLLLTVENTGVAVFEETPARRLPIDAIQRWRSLAAEGDVDTALAELNAEPTLSERDKSLLRLQVYGDAGIAPAVRGGLEANRDLLSDLKSEQALQVAALAEDSNAADVAAELLSGALEVLHRPAALELALEVADRLGNVDLIRRAREALEAADPGSAVLRRHRAARLAAQRRYREAAQMLEADQEADIVELAAFWTLLSDHLEGDGPVDAGALIEPYRSGFQHALTKPGGWRVRSSPTRAVGRRRSRCCFWSLHPA